MEQLERRELFAATLVDADKHRPPTALLTWGTGLRGYSIVTASHATSADGKAIIAVDSLTPDASGNLGVVTQHVEYADPDPGAAVYVAAGDVNGDGYNDVMVKLFSVTGQPTPVGESSNDSNVAVLGGDGNGGMQLRRTYVIPHILESSGSTKKAFVLPHVLEKSGIAAGDVNGDGIADLIDWDGDDVATVLLDAERGPRQTVSQRKGWDGTIKGASIVGAGDLNGDGRADLVAFDEAGQAVLYSSFTLDPKDPRSGGFRLDGRIDTLDSKLDGKIERVAVGDLDGDGKADDIALVGKESVSLGLGFTRTDPAGIDIFSFSWGATQLPHNFSPDDIHVGDVNGDGTPDVVGVKMKAKEKANRQYVGTVTIVK
jgi:hypothetical protein